MVSDIGLMTCVLVTKNRSPIEWHMPLLILKIKWNRPLVILSGMGWVTHVIIDIKN
jgi:hypothetical protein